MPELPPDDAADIKERGKKEKRHRQERVKKEEGREVRWRVRWRRRSEITNVTKTEEFKKEEAQRAQDLAAANSLMEQRQAIEEEKRKLEQEQKDEDERYSYSASLSPLLCLSIKYSFCSSPSPKMFIYFTDSSLRWRD